jgi:CRISPR-associated protein Cas1
MASLRRTGQEETYSLNPLLLIGFGSSVVVKDRSLVIREGRFSPLSFTCYANGEFREPKLLKFRPRQLPYDSVIVEGHSGMITFEAINWLMHHSTPVFMLDYDGSLISAIMPPQPIRGDLRRAQVEAHLDSEKRVAVARSFIEAKLERSDQMLNWLGESHDIERDIRSFREEAHGLGHAKTVDEIRNVEARAAETYWRAFQKAVPVKLEFKSRSTKARNRQYNASDPVNALLNYGYAFLQSSVRRAINTTGLDASLGYLHEDQPATTPLVYDFQEPYRWLVDYVVLRMVLSRAFSWDDFYFTGGDYRLRIKPPLLDRYAELLREQFNSGVMYGGKRLTWDTLILRKCQELAHYLLGKTTRFDLVNPNLNLEREETQALRKKILSLSSAQARKIGLNKSTLHYLRKRARDRKPFSIYEPVLAKLSS